MTSKNKHSEGPLYKTGAAPRELDMTDRRILSALRQNGRLTIAELAEEVGLSTSPCWSRLKRLEASGAIENYVAVINAKTIGVTDVFFVEITLDHHDDQILERFGQALADMPEVLEAHLVTGDYDYLVKIAVTDAAHYERFLRQTLYRTSGIRHTRSTFALRTLKREISVDPLLIPHKS
ncbi:Lrp/AsnC family transcriptional regulator [Affinibrenneria salicis]|uniref:Lrp/AsnC family transcriptional regulator n=1 Tax=Affinibrenneria salicis TaxID=2590031 RepID=A0A5J5FQ67_9GAMM|nr:Lrp/AsnC family transcriptional regulator [Affinibrenneria salicis]KAA8994934.1 Lrp/AsnC family transcriptional regulator [Affinibrenneria salicis]